jgi:hypothetical protein
VIYIFGETTYWAKEKDVGVESGHYVLHGNKSLMLHVTPNGQVQYVKLNSAAYNPKTLRLPVALTATIEEGAESLTTEFSAAVSGIIMPGPRR